MIAEDAALTEDWRAGFVNMASAYSTHQILMPEFVAYVERILASHAPDPRIEKVRGLRDDWQRRSELDSVPRWETAVRELDAALGDQP